MEPAVRADDLQDILAACYGNSKLAAEIFMPERFWRAFDVGMQGRIFDLLDNSDNPKKVIAAPRGIGKTSILNIFVPFTRILYKENSYIVPVSCTTSLAMQQSENLKEELINNQFILDLYGPLASDNFSKIQWVVDVLGTEICVMPRGAGQQIRGLLFRKDRPNLILVDDLEDPENMDSDEQRQKKKQWFFADLMNSIDRGVGSKWEIIVLGTILHQDSLLVNLLEDESWDSVQLEICDDEFKSNAPNFMPTDKVIELYEDFKRQGQMDVFYREYRNLPVPRGEDAAFPQPFFKDYDPVALNLNRNQNVENVIIIDPAKTKNPKSAESAIVGVGVDTKTQAWYVRDIVAEKFHPEELYEEIIRMIQRINARVIGVEVTSLHEFITYPLKNELLRKGINIEFVELHARGGDNEKGKIARVRSLIPFYRNGLVFHNPSCCKVLEGQLLSFPRPKRWDVMDALGYMPEMLEIGQRFMEPESTDDSKAAVEREFEELEKMDFDDEGNFEATQWRPLENFRIV